MSNPYFRFKRFTIWHDKCAMKVGTDGTLLGAWVDVSSCRTVLDIGTGTGLVALMIAQRGSYAVIDAVETDADTCRQATENVSVSPFAQQIHIHHASFQEFVNTVRHPYDLIVSNPPYFVKSLKCPESKRNIARHNDELSLAVLLAKSRRILAPKGRIALILPFLHQEEACRHAAQNNLHCVRQMHVIPVEGAQPKRLLIEFSPQPHLPIQTDTLILEHINHRRTEAYKTLVKDFYLD
ncbi:MAG: methyltransferase [Tannerella sp.]|jgi:tRNA1Val (adenine37-N6)-methyltransferase|nr:methyltransferase [Tannerella sp.]